MKHVKAISYNRYLIKGYKTLDDNFKQKLMALGFLPGVQFEILRSAPLGDPLQVRMLDTDIAVRKKDLASLQLEAMATEV